MDTAFGDICPGRLLQKCDCGPVINEKTCRNNERHVEQCGDREAYPHIVGFDRTRQSQSCRITLVLHNVVEEALEHA
jgi:hypothetical protein